MQHQLVLQTRAEASRPDRACCMFNFGFRKHDLSYSSNNSSLVGIVIDLGGVFRLEFFKPLY
jgi:hypothetical protein